MSGSSAPAPTTSAGLSAPASSSASSATASPSAVRARTTRPAAARSSCLVRFGGPVVHRHDHQGRPARGGRLVMGAGDGSGHVLRADGLVDPDGILAREAVQLAREERLGREMAPVLLADDDDERRAVDARGGQGADGVTEAGGRVQDRERRLAAPDRPAGRHADDRALVEPENEAKVVREVGEERDLGRPGIREERGEPVLAEDVERRFADRLDSHARSLYANDLIFSLHERDDARHEGDDRRRSRRRRRVDRLQSRAHARPPRGRPRRQRAPR